MNDTSVGDTENIEVERRRKISIKELELISPNKQIINQLVLLNSIALPISFGDIRSLHYKKVLKNELAIEGIENDSDDDEVETKYWTIMAYYNNSLVGAITVCIENIPQEIKQKSFQRQDCLYILTLAVLPSFRRRGVGSILFLNLITQCQKRWKNIKKIALHCQTCNESAISFYQKLGFVQVQLIQKYYSRWRICASDAYRLIIY